MKTMKDQQGQSTYVHCVLAAAPFPAARFTPITHQIFNIAFWCHYFIAAIPPSHSPCTQRDNVNIAGNEYRLILSELAPLAAIPAPIPRQWIRHYSPFRCSSAAACIPLNLALCVHCPKTGCVPTSQATTSPQPHWRPSVRPHQKHCFIVVT